MIFIDANIYMYIVGKPSPQKEISQRYLDKQISQKRRICCNTEILQEILHRFRLINASEIGFQLFDSILSLNIPIYPISVDDLKTAKMLLLEYPTLSTRDAVHAGMMQNRNIEKIATYDRSFSQIPWIQRIEP